MSFYVDELRIKSKEPDEQIKEIEQWARDLTEKLNHALNHLDETNFNESMVGKMDGTALKEVQSQLNTQYRELRELIIKRTS